MYKKFHACYIMKDPFSRLKLAHFSYVCIFSNRRNELALSAAICGLYNKSFTVVNYDRNVCLSL
jgi:hypothetical protein